MVYGTYNYSYWGKSKPTYNWYNELVTGANLNQQTSRAGATLYEKNADGPMKMVIFHGKNEKEPEQL